jgi:hypothetical protein
MEIPLKDQNQMACSDFEQELHQHFSPLSIDQQRQVLDFARALASARPRGVAGRQLLRFAGAIKPDDLDMISQAIVDDCEIVNPHEW